MNNYFGPLIGNDAEWVHVLRQIGGGCFRLNVSVSVFLCHCQLNGKKTIKTHVSQIFVSPFSRSVVGWAHVLENVGSDCR